MIKTTPRFDEIASGAVRPLDWDLNISFTKTLDDTIGWFTLDSSQLDSSDILSLDSDQSIQPWDYYYYQSYKKRLMQMNISRSVEFPYNVQSAILDFTLDNHDNYFTFNNSLSPVSSYILPNRPIRAYLGFVEGGLIPSFVGMTQELPNYSGVNDTILTWSAMDFLSQLGDQELGTIINETNIRTDEVIDIVLQACGLDPTMYQLDLGLVTIPYIYVQSDKNVGNLLRELIQAENGSMWLSESGIIRFAPRTADVGKTPVLTIEEGDIIDCKPSRTAGIENLIKIKSEIREVQDGQEVWSADNETGYSQSADNDPYRIPANGSITVWASFEDPVQELFDMELDGESLPNSSWMTAVNLSGTPVNSNITASAYNFVSSARWTITNDNAFAVSLTKIVAVGKPAKIVGETSYSFQDDDSIERFGVHKLEIENNYFGSAVNIDSFANDILSKRSDYSPVIDLTIKGNPALELGDIVRLNYKYSGAYKVIAKTENLTPSGGLKTKLKLERFIILSKFILDVSKIDDTGAVLS